MKATTFISESSLPKLTLSEDGIKNKIFKKFTNFETKPEFRVFFETLPVNQHPKFRMQSIDELFTKADTKDPEVASLMKYNEDFRVSDSIYRAYAVEPYYFDDPEFISNEQVNPNYYTAWYFIVNRNNVDCWIRTHSRVGLGPSDRDKFLGSFSI